MECISSESQAADPDELLSHTVHPPPAFRSSPRPEDPVARFRGVLHLPQQLLANENVLVSVNFMLRESQSVTGPVIFTGIPGTHSPTAIRWTSNRHTT